MNQQLTTFVKPRPNQFIMNILVHINRWVNLKGTQLLKWIPLVKKLPLVRGFCDITKIDFSKNDEMKLKSYINDNTIAFIGPNHPEFYTDWMLDKEISARVAPKMASWATHDVVNGMGKAMQKFWLKNNLIAQIPGTGNKEAKDYSVEHAISGYGVLLHPEGHVGWHSNTISPLFSGIFDMSMQAFEKSNGTKPVYIAPVIWKLVFNKNVNKELHSEISYINKELKLYSNLNNTVSERTYELFLNLFSKIALTHNINLTSNNIRLIQIQLINGLLVKISNEIKYDLTNDSKLDLKNISKLVKNQNNKNLKNSLKDLNNISSFTFNYYTNELLSQEQIAEILKKVRINFCTQGVFNLIHKFVPTPIASRTAYIEVPDAINLNNLLSENHGNIKEKTLNILQQKMQFTLDQLNHKLELNNKIIFHSNFLDL